MQTLKFHIYHRKKHRPIWLPDFHAFVRVNEIHFSCSPVIAAIFCRYFFYILFSTQPTCLFIPSVTAAAQNGIVDNHHSFHPILESIARPIAFATFFLRVTLAEHLFFYLAILILYSHWILYVMKTKLEFC